MVVPVLHRLVAHVRDHRNEPLHGPHHGELHHEVGPTPPDGEVRDGRVADQHDPGESDGVGPPQQRTQHVQRLAAGAGG